MVKVKIESYCACNSGWWYINADELKKALGRKLKSFKYKNNGEVILEFE